MFRNFSSATVQQLYLMIKIIWNSSKKKKKKLKEPSLNGSMLVSCQYEFQSESTLDS